MMKKIGIILAALLLMVCSLTQAADAQTATLNCSGNRYSYGDQALRESVMLDWYARHNCQAAYDLFLKGQETAVAGWVLFGTGLGMTIAGATCMEVCMSQSKKIDPTVKRKDLYQKPLYMAGMCMCIGASALEIASVPMLIVGYHRMHSSVDVYNAECTATAQAKPYWAIQASENGLGLALKF